MRRSSQPGTPKIKDIKEIFAETQKAESTLTSKEDWLRD